MERKESVIHSVHITKIELHRGKEPECFYASGFISFEFMHSLCRTNYTEERRKSFNICNVPIYQKQGVYDLDELDPERGRKEDEISFDCGIFCHLFFLENQEGQKDEPTKEE
jgi:hypothetical protein